MRHVRLFPLLILAGLFTASIALAQDGGTAIDAATAADAATAPASPPSLTEHTGGFIETAYEHFTEKNWWPFASMLVIALVWAARRYAPKIDWFRTDRGGVALTLATSFLGALAHNTLAGAEIDLEMVVTAGEVAVGAIAGYTGVKKLLFGNQTPKAAS